MQNMSVYSVNSSALNAMNMMNMSLSVNEQDLTQLTIQQEQQEA